MKNLERFHTVHTSKAGEIVMEFGFQKSRQTSITNIFSPQCPTNMKKIPLCRINSVKYSSGIAPTCVWCMRDTQRTTNNYALCCARLLRLVLLKGIFIVFPFVI